MEWWLIGHGLSNAGLPAAFDYLYYLHRSQHFDNAKLSATSWPKATMQINVQGGHVSVAGDLMKPVFHKEADQAHLFIEKRGALFKSGTYISLFLTDLSFVSCLPRKQSSYSGLCPDRSDEAEYQGVWSQGGVVSWSKSHQTKMAKWHSASDNHQPLLNSAASCLPSHRTLLCSGLSRSSLMRYFRQFRKNLKFPFVGYPAEGPISSKWSHHYSYINSCRGFVVGSFEVLWYPKITSLGHLQISVS